MSTTLSPDPTAVLDQVPTGLLIGEHWRAAEGGRTFRVEDPATGATLADVAAASPRDGLNALDAAAAAQERWAAVPPGRRVEILRPLTTCSSSAPSGSYC